MFERNWGRGISNKNKKYTFKNEDICKKILGSRFLSRMRFRVSVEKFNIKSRSISKVASTGHLIALHIFSLITPLHFYLLAPLNNCSNILNSRLEHDLLGRKTIQIPSSAGADAF